jgi:uncharacterized protein (UPF0332 family)
MFYAALALLQKIGKVPSKDKGVISLFDAEFVRLYPFALRLFLGSISFAFLIIPE